MSVTSLAGCPLPAHDPDPEEPDHHIAPGSWEPVTCEESEHLRGDVHVWSSLTDLDGQYGRAVVFTCWGSPDGSLPVLAEARWPNADGSGPDERPCEHYAYRTEARA